MSKPATPDTDHEFPGQVLVSEQLLDEALEESFPASDPLSFWSGRDSAGRTREETDPMEGPAPTG